MTIKINIAIFKSIINASCWFISLKSRLLLNRSKPIGSLLANMQGVMQKTLLTTSSETEANGQHRKSCKLYNKALQLEF